MVDLKAFLYHNNLTQNELARYLGVSSGYMSRIMNGTAPLSGANIIKLIENKEGWDLSHIKIDEEDSLARYLLDKQSKYPKAHQKETDPQIGEYQAYITKLESENKLLREQLAWFQKIIAEKLSI